MVTMIDLKQDVLRVLNKRDEALANLPIPMTTNAASPGSTTTINDARLGRGTGQPNRFDGRIIEIVERPVADPDADAASGEAAGIDDAGFDNVDTITFSPPLLFEPNVSQNYLLYGLGLSKEPLEGAVNEVLRETRGPHIFFPSLVTDSDLDAGGVTNWTDVGTPSTVAEVVVTTPNVLLGARSIHAIADAATEGFQSDAFDVHETETLIVSVHVRATVGSVIVQLYNETAGADIKSVTIDEPAWTEVRFTQAVPADCEQVRIRIISDAASDDFVMGAHCVVQVVGGRSYSMPSWLETEEQILDWIYVPRGAGSEDADSYVSLGEPVKREQVVSVLRDERAVHPFRIELKPANANPVAMIAQRAFAEIALGVLGTNTTAGTAGTNEATTPIDREYARSRVIANLFRDFGDNGFKFWARAAAVRAELKHYGLKTIQINPTPTVAL